MPGCARHAWAGISRMTHEQQEPWRSLAWASIALAAGTLLHIDRIPLWTTAAEAICIGWRLSAAAGVIGLPSRSARTLLALVLVAAVYLQFRTLNGLNAGTVL